MQAQEILVCLVCLRMTRPGRIRPPITLFCLPEAETLLCKLYPKTNIQEYKYTNTQINKHTNTNISLSSVYQRPKHFCASFNNNKIYTRIQINKSTNIQINKHPNTKISLSYQRPKHFCANFALQSFAFQNSFKIRNFSTINIQFTEQRAVEICWKCGGRFDFC